MFSKKELLSSELVTHTPKSLGFQDFLFSNQGLAKYSKDSLWAVLAGGSREAANATQASEYTQGPKVPKF